MNATSGALEAARTRVCFSALLMALMLGRLEARGAFTLIDDFETYPTGASMNGQTNGQGTWTTITSVGGENFFAAADLTTPGNQVLSVENHLTEGAADPSQVAGVGSALLVDPRINITDGSVATFFFRFWRGHASSDVVWGFIDSSAPAEVGNLSWEDINTGLRNSVTEQNGITVGQPGRRSNFDGRNANSENGNELSNIDIDPLPTGEWFNVWMVVHNDGTYAPVNFISDSADYVSLYIQSEQTFPAQTQLQTAAGDKKFTFAFDSRMPPPGPPTAGTDKALTGLFMRMGLGPLTEAVGLENNHTGPWYLDDLYLDLSGANLAHPIPEPTSAFVAVGGLAFAGTMRRRLAWKTKWLGQ